MKIGILSKIWNAIKSGVKKIINAFKDKSPAQIIDDASKAAIGIATVAAVAYAGYNVIRSLFIRGNGKRQNDRRSGADVFYSDREPGSIDEKLARARRNSSENFGKRSLEYAGLTQDDLDLLEEVAKTRNVTFKSMTPAQQWNLLIVEGFDFKAYREKMKRERNTHRIRKSVRRVGEASPEDKSFREPVDYGWLNFIMRPLDDFLCWLKNDPTPKKVPQIHLISKDMIPSIEVSSAEDVASSLRALHNCMDALDPENAEKEVLGSIADERERVICAEEIFKHKSVKGYRKAVASRMLSDENGLSSQIFNLMDEEVKKGKKKKHHKKDRKPSFYGEDKKGGNKKKDKAASADADKEALKIYDYYVRAAIDGKEVHRPCRLDKLYK